MQGVLIAGTHSGGGKTTLTLALLAALRARGMRIRGFKAGPDFIDAGLHGLVTGIPSSNLDLWMCGPEGVATVFGEDMQNSDFALVEGLMGLFDGQYSSGRLAEFLGLPVVLVVDAFGQAESAAAVVLGFQEYARRHYPGLRLAAVLFNRVGSPSHFERLREAVSAIEVLGYLPRDPGFELPHRHLGLTVAEESPLSANQLQALGESLQKHADMERLLRLCVIEKPAERRSEPSPPLRLQANPAERVESRPRVIPSKKPFRIAVAYDRAFCFYYRDNFNLLRQAGAELVFFSPLSDAALPTRIDALYLGGGYPELHAETLSANKGLVAEVGAFSAKGGSVYAECGGLMYLSRGVHGTEGRFHPMCGVLPLETAMKKEKARLGYREVELKQECFLGEKGWKIRGHEFHYSEVKDLEGPLNTFYKITDNRGKSWADEGYGIGNTLASYVHLHFRSCPQLPKKWLGSI